jgi:hypothetical protein
MGPAGLQPGLFHVLQHRQGNLQGWAKSYQQGRSGSLTSAAWFHDRRRMGRISVWKEAGPGASFRQKFRLNVDLAVPN